MCNLSSGVLGPFQVEAVVGVIHLLSSSISQRKLSSIRMRAARLIAVAGIRGCRDNSLQQLHTALEAWPPQSRCRQREEVKA